MFAKISLKTYSISSLIVTALVVIASCDSSNSGTTFAITSTCGEVGGFCRIFETTSPMVNGGLDASGSENNGHSGDADSNGVDDADAICNADAKKLTSNDYKALIVRDLVRVACTTADCGAPNTGAYVDWVLQADTEYRRNDGTTVIGTTDSDRIFSIDLTNSLGTSGSYWSGLNNDWTAATTIDCSDWVNTTGSVNGVIGSLTAVDMGAFSNGNATCDTTTSYLVCVEQP